MERIGLLSFLFFGVLVGCLWLPGAAAQPSAAAAAGYETYVAGVAARLTGGRAQGADETRLQRGDVIVERVAPGVTLPGALLHDWRATALIAGARRSSLERLLRDFRAYPRVFAPEVVEARETGGAGDHVQAFLRVRQKHVMTVTLDTSYDVTFGAGAGRGWSVSRSLRVQEVDGAGRVLPEVEGHGFVWRTVTFWNYEERDGGLLVQVESVSLSRGIPAGLGWAVRPYVESVPRESLAFTLQAVRKALEEIMVNIQNEFRAATRVHGALTASLERKALLWMAAQAPAWVTSDGLTLLGLLAQMGAGVCYGLARFDRQALWLVCLCLVLNWLGDSLDGTVARVRGQQRPRYGFYVDHVVDVLGSTALMAGMGLSGLVHWQVALGMLVAFLLLASESYLATYTLGKFEMSQGRFGPTELRLLLIAANMALLRSPSVTVAGHRMFLLDVGGSIGMAGMAAMLGLAVLRHAAQLYHEEPLA